MHHWIQRIEIYTLLVFKAFLIFVIPKKIETNFGALIIFLNENKSLTTWRKRQVGRKRPASQFVHYPLKKTLSSLLDFRLHEIS